MEWLKDTTRVNDYNGFMQKGTQPKPNQSGLFCVLKVILFCFYMPQGRFFVFGEY